MAYRLCFLIPVSSIYLISYFKFVLGAQLDIIQSKNLNNHECIECYSCM